MKKGLISLDVAVDVLECMNLGKDLYATNSDIAKECNKIAKNNKDKCDNCPYKQIVNALKLAWRDLPNANKRL